MPALYLMCGLPGCGKTTYIKEHLGRYDIHVSRDKIRFGRLGAKDEYFSKEQDVFKEFCRQINDGLAKGYNVYADATHLNLASRNKLLDKINLNDSVGIFPINFLVDEDTCQERNAQRSGRAKVPETVIHNMAQSYIPATFNEKYKYIAIISIDKDGNYKIVYDDGYVRANILPRLGKE